MVSPNWLHLVGTHMQWPGILEGLIWPAAIIGAVLVSAAVAVWLADDRRQLVAIPRERFVWGVPWGSIIVLGSVLAIYLFVQDGRSDLTAPVYLPYVNWSYLYPTGVVLAPFTHGSFGHILSNMLAAVVLAPIAEYIWGHYPDEDPYHLERPLRDHPLVRAFFIFPLAVIFVGFLSSVFAWGPVIGFSGVVFAFAGFVIIKYPIVAIVALAVRTVIARVGDAIFNPIVVAEVERSVSEPGWVGVSFQGHALGFFIGIVLAIVLFHRRRREKPARPIRLWTGLIIVATSLSMWAIWFSRGSETYVLYQGLGMILLFLGAGLVVVAARASAQSVWGRMKRRHVALAVLLIPLVTISMVAIPMNVLTVAPHDTPEDTITVGDYDVFYGQDVEGQLRPVIDRFDDESPGTTSGVIVVSEDRHLWTRPISSTDLERDGEGAIQLGGIGWRSEIEIERHGWTPIGNESVYRVDLLDGQTKLTSFTSEERTADATIAGHHLSIGIEGDDFIVIATGPDGERATAAIPDEDTNVTVGNLTIQRTDGELVASIADTRISIADRDVA